MTQDNDPWGNNPRNTDGNDLTSLLHKFKDSLFGGGGSEGDRAPQNSGGGLPTLPKKAIAPLAAAVGLGWLATGFYILPEGFHGVELTFGRYSQTTAQSGVNFRWPTPVGSEITVDIGSLRTLSVGSSKGNSEGQMLTSDENIVEISLSVQYKVGKAEDYLFNVNNPEQVLKESLISSIREVVGASKVDYILIDGRTEWPAKVRENLVATLEGFKVGFEILRVELSEAKAPLEVQDAFDDAVKAREDADRYKLQAEAYQNKEVPLARGQAKQIIEQAEAYKASIVAKATGEATRFDEVLKTYRLAPQVTRDRLYIETLQKVYENVNNVVVATGENAPLMYLPVGQNTGVSTPLPLPTQKQSSENGNHYKYQSQPLENSTLTPKTTSKRLTR